MRANVSAVCLSLKRPWFLFYFSVSAEEAFLFPTVAEKASVIFTFIFCMHGVPELMFSPQYFPLWPGTYAYFVSAAHAHN